MEGIQHALTILSWHENFIAEEIPPETIWDDSEGIEEWFKAVKLKQKQKWENPGSSGGGDDGDGDSGSEPAKGDNSMMGNELADFFRQ